VEDTAATNSSNAPPPKSLSKGLRRRFWWFFKFVTVAGPKGCWCWTGPRFNSRQEYGRITVNGVSMPAHRFAYELFRGPIPKKMLVCHSCDQQVCVNPDHLFLGTHQDNMADMVAKQRSSHIHGESHPNAKLTDELVAEIRSSPETQKELAERLHVSQALISKVRHRRIWAHLP
jgi:hypothetical protein